MSEVVKVKNSVELEKVIASNRKVVVNFSQSAGCAPCKALLPHYEGAASVDSSAVYVYVDVLKMPEVIQEFDFMRTPTVILFENGKRVADVHARTAMQIISEIKR